MISFLKRRRPAVVGLMLGATVGLMVALGYGLTSAWLCSGIRKCPASWEPFVIVSAIIFLAITPIGVVVASFGARLYRIFDTALYPDGDGNTGPDGEESERG